MLLFSSLGLFSVAEPQSPEAKFFCIYMESTKLSEAHGRNFLPFTTISGGGGGGGGIYSQNPTGCKPYK